MSDAKAVILDHRGLLRIGGADRIDFLQGIVSNDVARVSPGRTVWSAFLTPQGKFLHEFFLAVEGAGEGETFLLDCEAARRADLARRLKLYKLRSQVTVEDASEDYAVAALIGDDALAKLGLPEEPGATAPCSSPSPPGCASRISTAGLAEKPRWCAPCPIPRR